ncbi:MAG: NAD-dependent epimerase/dehydratase family protein [Alphaproteobacteria bacterium]|nr:NAD-dependent epimerase/dehydratase family protein [Alphaproteobacteria bacterium]
MRVVVTGATGGIGHAATTALRARGDDVRVVVRDLDRAAPLLPDGVEAVLGDLLDPASLDDAIDGADLVVHAAGMPEQWVRDPAIFDRVHRLGTRHVLDAARRAKVFRVLHVSTMDVFACPPGGTLREDHPDPHPKPTAYERSKVAAERVVDEAVAAGLDVVVVNPAAVYGPGPSRVGMNRLILDARAGRSPLLPPGGMAHVFAPGLAQAMLAALDRGQPGRRYLIADGYADLPEIVRTVVEVAGAGRVPPTGPAWLLGLVAFLGDLGGRWLGVPPLVSRGELQFLSWRARVDSRRAQEELGFVPTPLRTGIEQTLAALASPP